MAAKVPHVAVVGAGWGGWAAAQTLLENGCKVTLLDSLPDPTGETPYRTPTGKPFEAGTRGFWKDYPNIEALVASLCLKDEDVFNPFTNSSFYSPDGLEATAPVFSSATIPFTENPLRSCPRRSGRSPRPSSSSRTSPSSTASGARPLCRTLSLTARPPLISPSSTASRAAGPLPNPHPNLNPHPNIPPS